MFFKNIIKIVIFLQKNFHYNFNHIKIEIL